MIARLSASELSRFEARLRQQRERLVRELRSTGERAARERFAQVASEAPDNEDAALANLIGEVNSAEMARDVGELRDTDEALGRITAGSYGLCQRCGEPIDPARLEAFPAAKYDRRCQEVIERQRGQRTTPTL